MKSDKTQNISLDATKFPLSVRKIGASDENMNVFTEMVKFCSTSSEELAKILEPILRAQAAKINYETAASKYPWYPLERIAIYTQPIARKFKEMFLPGCIGSRVSSRKVSFVFVKTSDKNVEE